MRRVPWDVDSRGSLSTWLWAHAVSSKGDIRIDSGGSHPPAERQGGAVRWEIRPPRAGRPGSVFSGTLLAFILCGGHAVRTRST